MNIKQIGPSLTGAVQNTGAASVKPNGEDKTGASNSISSDRVELSQSYRELTQARKALMTSGDVRAEKVDQIKNQLASGNYQINPAGIADKMLEEVM